MSSPSEVSEHPSNADGGQPASSTEAPTGRIAVCLDGSEVGERILPHALALAQALAAHLTLLRVLEVGRTGGAPADPLGWDIRRRETRQHLERMAERLDERLDGGGSVEVEVIEGHAAEEIGLWARHHGVALTVLCSHGVRGETEWSLASTARKLLEGAPGTFLLVPAAAAYREGVARYRRVLVPVDGSPRAESVLPLATRVAEAQGAELVLAHVPPVPELTEVGPPDADDLDLVERLLQRNRRVATEYLDRLRARLAGSDAPVRALVLPGGDARTRLARLIAEEGVDLVVLSAHGRSARSEVPFGSVAAHLVAHAVTPVLIVRHPEAASRRRVARARREGIRLPPQATP